MNKIYLACPYTHHNQKIRELRFELVTELAMILTGEGNNVYSPITSNHLIAKNSNLPMTWEFWQERDIQFIDWCDELYVYCLEGWRESKGIKHEIEYAKAIGKSITYINYNGDVFNPDLGNAI